MMRSELSLCILDMCCDPERGGGGGGGDVRGVRKKKAERGNTTRTCALSCYEHLLMVYE